MPARWGAPLAAQLQPLANRQRRLGAVQSIKVDGRRAALDRLAAQLGDDIGAEFADRIDIVAERFQTLGDPARDLRAAHVGEAAQLRILRDRHDPRRDRHADAELARVVDEAEIRIGVEEVLCDRAVRAGVDLALEVGEIAYRIAGLRVHFGIAGVGALVTHGCSLESEPSALDQRAVYRGSLLFSRSAVVTVSSPRFDFLRVFVYGRSVVSSFEFASTPDVLRPRRDFKRHYVRQ